MRSCTLVTTCNADGWERYGRRMTQSVLKFWPERTRLLLYAEGFEPEFSDPRMEVRDLAACSPGLTVFKARHKDNPLARGGSRRFRPRLRLKTGGPRGMRLSLQGLRWGQGYRWDAVRFAHKSFATFDAARTCGTELLIWLDADTVATAPISDALIERLTPADCIVGCLKRDIHSETGLVAYNLAHPAMPAFMAAFERLYAEDALFAEYEFHDAYLFDVIRRRFEKSGASSHDIAAGAGAKARHVLVNCELGAVMDHLKGERKGLERSPDADRLPSLRPRFWRLAKSTR